MQRITYKSAYTQTQARTRVLIHTESNWNCLQDQRGLFILNGLFGTCRDVGDSDSRFRAPQCFHSKRIGLSMRLCQLEESYRNHAILGITISPSAAGATSRLIETRISKSGLSQRTTTPRERTMTREHSVQSHWLRSEGK